MTTTNELPEELRGLKRYVIPHTDGFVDDSTTIIRDIPFRAETEGRWGDLLD